LSPYLFATPISPKHIIICSSIGTALLETVPAVVPSNLKFVFWFLLVARASAGFFKVLFTVYFPVWIDRFAPRTQQALWISIYYFISPLGVAIGYSGTLGLERLGYQWRTTFLGMTALLLLPSGLGYCFFSTRMYDTGRGGY
jgi:hypothetical protein